MWFASGQDVACCGWPSEDNGLLAKTGCSGWWLPNQRAWGQLVRLRIGLCVRVVCLQTGLWFCWVHWQRVLLVGCLLRGLWFIWIAVDTIFLVWFAFREVCGCRRTGLCLLVVACGEGFGSCGLFPNTGLLVVGWLPISSARVACLWTGFLL
jgi:hypothetical protein